MTEKEVLPVNQPVTEPIAEKQTQETPITNQPTPTIQQKQKNNNKSPAELIVDLLPNCCHLFKSQYGDLFAKVKIENLNRIMKIRSQEFMDFIILQYFQQHKKIASYSTVNEAINYVAAHAYFSAKEEMVFYRVGSLNETVYVDMADKENNAIEIKAEGWKMIQNPPINFIRSSSIRPLFTPVIDGSLKSFRKYVKVASNADFLMLISWLIFSLNDDGPFPILFICGDEGTTKSNLIKMIHAIVDPSTSTNLSMPKNKHDVYITAVNSRIISYDNLTKIPKWFSNELCVIATGNDFSTRQYYTVDQQALLHAKRPQIISGINNSIASEKDILDRIVCVNLLPLTREERKDEKLLWTEFNKIKGQLLGAICTAFSTGLKNYNSINPPYLERMADFAKFMIACEPALPCKQGDFMQAYENNIMKSKNKSLYANHVASAVVCLMKDNQTWKETAENTIIALSQYVTDPMIITNSDNWPQAGNKLRSFLDKARAVLTDEGISFQCGVAEKGNRYIIFTNFLSASANIGYESSPEIQEVLPIEDVFSEQPPVIISDTTKEDEPKKDIVTRVIDDCVDVEILASLLEEKYKIPVDNIKKIIVEGDKVIVITESGEIRLEKKSIMTKEQLEFEEAIKNLSPEEQKFQRILFNLSQKLQ